MPKICMRMLNLLPNVCIPESMIASSKSKIKRNLPNSHLVANYYLPVRPNSERGKTGGDHHILYFIHSAETDKL